jgi:hypothetical protein
MSEAKKYLANENAANVELFSDEDCQSLDMEVAAWFSWSTAGVFLHRLAL